MGLAALASMLVLTFGPGGHATTGGDKVVLTNPAHTVSLIYQREKTGDAIMITQTWSYPKRSRIVASTYTTRGAPTERSIATTEGLKTSRADAKISFHAAVVTSTARNGQSPSSEIPLLKKMTIEDPSILWFDGTTPKPGEVADFMSFNPEFRYWEQVTVTFEGRGKLGVSPEGNLVMRRSAKDVVHLLLDDKGMPIVWEDGRLRLSRAK